jgi:predicted acylesterase/phospholipase RssA
VATIIGIFWFAISSSLNIYLRVTALIGGLSVIDLLLLRNRPIVVSWAFATKLFSRSGKSTKLAGLPNSTVDHVICATDLVFGEHVYFSRQFVYSYRHGGGTPGPLSLGAAVQTSSCFPGALPARWIRTDQFSFPDRPEVPSKMALIDGGVYDNMGDEWLVNMDDRRKRKDGFPNHVLTPEVVIIVNSSAGQEMSRLGTMLLPFVGELFGLLRIINTLFENTTTTRRRYLLSRFVKNAPRGCFVMIERSPRSVAASSLKSPDADVRRRSADVLASLDCQSTQFWDDLAKATAHAPTTFRGLGNETAAKLIWHGYLNAVCNTHVVLGYPLLKLPTYQDFLDYVKNA